MLSGTGKILVRTVNFSDGTLDQNQLTPILPDCRLPKLGDRAAAIKLHEALVPAMQELAMKYSWDAARSIQ